MPPTVFEPAPFPDHALLDSGDGEKLERFGSLLLRRPDPQALWRPRLPRERWEACDLRFERDPRSGGRSGSWRARRGDVPGSWTVGWRDARFVLRPTAFKHVGLFPEQASNWAWLSGLDFGVPEPRLLNLFGYTGAASIAALQAGYRVTHVDASRTSLAWARENLEASGLPADAMRVLLEDALGFARREARRGARYELVFLDPPHHGRGPKGETWEFATGIADLVETCARLLEPRSALCLSAYAIGISPRTLSNLLAELEGGELEVDELALPEVEEEGLPRRDLPAGFCARWTRGAGPRP